MKKRIVLCADDFGQAPSISQGIMELVKKGKLSAVSCMVTTEYWPEHAVWLQPFQSQIDIGLHFNLTEGKTPLPKLMLQALMGKLDQEATQKELHRQLDAFQRAMGFLPHFLDGHQHVHQFPIIREALVKVYEERLRSEGTYIRVINQKLTSRDFFKKAMIEAMGTRALTKLLRSHKIPFNQSFSGIYNFARAGHYAALFPTFLAEVEEGGLIMCHPGLPPTQPNDPIAAARYFEYQYLSGLRFKIDCDAQKCEIGRFAGMQTRRNNVPCL